MKKKNYIVIVSAQSFNPETGEAISPARDERCVINNNPVFNGCKTLTDVVEAYQSFWNRLPTKSSEMVLVQKIRWVT
jgi:hypothetical protein